MSATTTALIDQPGLYDVDELTYHADTALAPGFGPSLSSTGARLLLPPSCPALFRHAQDEPREDKAAFDLGHAVHQKVLGVGLDIATIPDDTLASNGAASTKEAKAFIAEARARGAIPVKSDVARQVDAVTEKVLAHPVAAAILSQGQPERSAYAVDPDTGVTMRARIDWLRDNAAVDLKTTSRRGGSNPAAFAKHVAEHGYHIQADWYLRVLAALGMADLPFIHIIAETEAPYLVSVVQLDDEALAIGHDQARRALDTYATCTTTDTWPAWGADIQTVSLPTWYARNHL